MEIIMPPPQRPIIRIQEDDHETAPISSLERRLNAIRRSGEVPTIITIDDGTDEVQNQSLEALENEIAEVIDLDEEVAPVRALSASPSRNLPIDAQSLLSEYWDGHLCIKKDTVVEVSQRPTELSWQFLQVHQIYRNGIDVIFRGIRLTRQRYLEGMLPRNRNEVCALFEVQKDDNREWIDQAVIDVPAPEVIRIRQLRQTNAPFPQHRFDSSLYISDEAIENHAPLVQRWVFVTLYKSSSRRQARKSLSGIMRRLREDEIKDPKLRVSNSSLRNAWRGGIVPGGSYIAGDQTIPVAELEVPQAEPVIKPFSQRYSAGDFFCGAGGASCGMKRAGFEVVIACDMDPAACETYRTNFPRTELLEIEVHDFVRIQNGSKRHTDVLHLSPPCQTWSPAHTRPGQNDDANADAILSCGDINTQERPRITTGEQTFGILHGKHKKYFHSLVNQYTSLGYSIRWDVINLSNYGLAQPRKRLIWIASCPGEALPPFPAATHGTGLRQPVTVHQVLTTLRDPRRDPLHNVAHMLWAAERSGGPKPPWDPKAPLRRSITTGCTDNYHPSGLRNFTIRESALLQGFPPNYHFRGRNTEMKRQIGNAFPPSVVGVLYSHIHRWLLRQDNVVERAMEIDGDDHDEVMVIGELRREIIAIDNDDDDGDEDGDGETRPADRIDTHGRREVVVIDDDNDNDEDDEMSLFERDGVAEYDMMRFSRESSRTLSVGSQQDVPTLD